MNTFYQIVTKSEVDGNWVGFFIENSDIYKTYEEAYKKAEELAKLKTQGMFNNHLTVQYRSEKYLIQESMIQILNTISKN